MNVICSNEDVNSHFCDVFEIENAWISSGVYFASPFEGSWVDFQDGLGVTNLDNPSMDGSNWFTDTCRGWLSSDFVDRGAYIRDYADYFLSDDGENYCDNIYHVTCCKWIP